jgi:hypothetical protein
MHVQNTAIHDLLKKDDSLPTRHSQASLSTCEQLLSVPCDTLSENKAAFNKEYNCTL